MAKGNRNLKAKHEKSIRQKIEASWMERSKAFNRPMGKDIMVREEHQGPARQIAIDVDRTIARLDRAKAALEKCTLVSRLHKGRRVLQSA